MKKQKKFFVRVVTSFENEGDLLINRALIKAFSPSGEVLIDQHASPDDFLMRLTKDISNVRLEPKFYKTLFAEAFTKHDVYLLTIPGHFFGTGLKKCLQTLTAAMFFYLLKILGVKVIKVGGCVGPFDSKVRLAERFRSGAFSFYGLRDSISIDNIDLSSTNNSFPDLAFITDDITGVQSQRENQKNVLVSFRKETNAMAKSSGYVEQIKSKLPTLLDTYRENYKIILAYQVPSDKPFNLEIYQQLVSLGFDCDFVEQKLGLHQALQMYADASLVLSNRLHILLPCIGLGTPHRGILDTKNHHKIVGIYRDIGLSDLLIDVDEDVGASTLNNVMQDYPSEVLMDIYQKQSHRAQELITDIVSQ